jgi:hypothetical protein
MMLKIPGLQSIKYRLENHRYQKTLERMDNIPNLDKNPLYYRVGVDFQTNQPVNRRYPDGSPVFSEFRELYDAFSSAYVERVLEAVNNGDLPNELGMGTFCGTFLTPYERGRIARHQKAYLEKNEATLKDIINGIVEEHPEFAPIVKTVGF